MKAFLLLVCLMITLASSRGLKIKYKDCGSTKGVVKYVDVSGCNSMPCKLKRGETHSVNIAFTSNTNSDTASVKATGIVAGIPFPYPIGNKDACTCGVTCPVIMSDDNVYSYGMEIKSYFPAVKVVVKWEIQTDSGDDLVCVLFPAEVE